MNGHGQSNNAMAEYHGVEPDRAINFAEMNFYPQPRPVRLPPEPTIYPREVNFRMMPYNNYYGPEERSVSPRTVSEHSNSPVMLREIDLDESVSDYDEYFPYNNRSNIRQAGYRASKRTSTSAANRPMKRRHKAYGIRQNTLLPNLQAFLKEKRFGDMVLSVGGREITCHYLIMAASSPYFKCMLESKMKESIEKRLEINDFDYNVVEMIVNYAYGMCINLDKENAESLLEAADYFQMSMLRKDCERFLTKNIDASNCLRLIDVASIRSLEKLERSAKRYSLKHFFKVSQNEEFLELPEDQLIQYLKNDDLYVEREEHVFDAVVRWLEQNGKPDLNFCSALGCVRFTFLSSSFLYNVVQHSRFFQEHAGTQKIFHEACKLHALGVTNAKTTDLFITTPRSSAGITSVIVMVGGICSNSRLVHTDCYDSKTNNWNQLCEIKTPHGSMHSYSVCSHANNIYITGGHSNAGATVDAVSIYLSNIDQWNCLQPMIHPRERHGSAALDGCVYVAGGLLASQKDRRKPGVLELVERYKPSFNRWEEVKSLPKRCYSPGVVAYKEKLYIIGGVSIDEDSRVCKTVLDCVQCYNPIDDSWTVNPLGKELARLSCAHYRDHFYMISNNSHWVYRYNPTTFEIEEWVEIPGNTVEFAGLQVFRDHLIISGGQRENVTLNVMYTIDIEQRTIIQNHNMNRPRCMHGCVVINKFG